MQLIYRGTTFNYDPSQSAVRNSSQQTHQFTAPYSLIYRGMTYKVDPNAKGEKISQQSRMYELIYRGMKYSVNRNEQGEVIAITATAIASKQQQPLTTHYSDSQALQSALGDR
jgi:hypothetical protein